MALAESLAKGLLDVMGMSVLRSLLAFPYVNTEVHRTGLGAAVLTLITVAMVVYNRLRIAKENKAQ